MMLLRDIAFGGKVNYDKVNFVYSILSVDAHETFLTTDQIQGSRKHGMAPMHKI
jgi:hypothetical protein